MGTASKLPEVAGKSLLVRPRYSPGLMLQDDDLTQAVDYVRELSRLMFKTLFGCGVMCGFTITAEEKCGKWVITIADGVAMDCHGDPVQVPHPQSIPLDESCGVTIPDQIWIVVRRREYCCAPRDAMCAPEDDSSAVVCTRVLDGFEIRFLGDEPMNACSCIVKQKDDKKQDDKKKDEGRAGQGAHAQHSTRTAVQAEVPVWADPADLCYHDHYQGECACGCDSDWVVLARIHMPKPQPGSNATPGWQVDYGVRRFIRPVLMRDPLK